MFAFFVYFGWGGGCIQKNLSCIDATIKFLVVREIFGITVSLFS